MLTDASYGKAAVRLVRVARGERHRIRDLTVEVRFAGRYEASYQGDNRAVLPTDTMKNTVYALARSRQWEEPETLALALAEHFLAGNSELERVQLDMVEHLWEPLPAADGPRPHAFRAIGPEERLVRVTAARGEPAVEGGLRGLRLLRTTGSEFADFRRDALTTLEDAEDRILATRVTAWWRPIPTGAPFGEVWSRARQALLDGFADHPSRSVQHTLRVMGEALLAACPEVAEVSLELPNEHHLPVDLGRFGLDNPGAVFVAPSQPYGVIRGTVRRS
ncbi:MAG TPA: urate oxidase [Thermoanaerobaculia bacterium]|nr:urate oxidase [Thermoanaerobaculia bacterium]